VAEPAGQYIKAIARSAEQRMRQWAIGHEVEQRVEQEHAAEELPDHIHPFLAISRESGCGAEEVARAVGKTLDWDVLDKELLHSLANEYQLEEIMLELVDESRISWLVETLGKWLDQRIVTESEYVTRLGQFALLAAHHRSTVFVGRGIQFLLPRERGMAVQIVAPFEARVNRIMKEEGFDRKEARKFLEKRDRARRDFIREHFNHEASDPCLYDLVINLGYVSPHDAAQLIVSQCQRRFPA
jgi:cytidylate kinase